MLNRIKELRNKNNLTLRALGQKVNMSSSRLSQYETGKREPKLETWQKLADFFDVPTSYLQGFGISKKDAINICWEWIYGKRGFNSYPIDELFKNFFKENFSQKDLKIIFKDKQAFTNFMSDRFRSVFNYNSLANIRDDEELEKKMTIALSGWSRKNVYDGVLAELQDIDFKKDSNDEIIEKLSSIFTDIFMYIDSDDNNKN
ncbi:helix-turn-helix domain-containing protein [Lactobacillus johnsonii]|uniref:helix-turn-helix domain-containing protein n=1 Tax=Lactobacillus johnsonii TaxID=33959 RepID=UPI003D04886A